MQHFDHLLYLRIHEGCNIFCEHCFIPANPKRMSLDQIAAVPEIVAKFASPGDVIRVQWHGGEPTLVGEHWMRQAVNAINECRDYIWHHDLQTNLVNYSPEWGDVFHDCFGGQIGVSWDAGIRLLRKNDPCSAEEYDELFFDNLLSLVRDGVQPSITVTATRKLFERYRTPFGILDCFESYGIREIHIERITQVGRARENWDSIGLSNAAYSEAMSRWLRCYETYIENGGPIRISPFDGMVNALQGNQNARGCWSGHCDSRFHTIDAGGYKSGCTALNSEYDNKRAGSNVIRIEDIGGSRYSRRADCTGCAFNDVCATGCLTVPYRDSSGECSGASQLWSTAHSISKKKTFVQMKSVESESAQQPSGESHA